MPTTHTVVQGETLGRIATRYGFTHWRTLYDDPANAAFRRRRPNPNVLLPGDEISIPDAQPRSRPVTLEQRNRFVVRRSVTTLDVRLQHESADASPLADLRYRLEISSETHEGRTTRDGRVHINIADGGAEDARLTVWLRDDTDDERMEWTLRVGHLDPTDAISGLQARLNNLAYDTGDEGDTGGPKTEAALRAFQQAAHVAEDDPYGPRTRAALADAHLC